jgi:hypothetical protein
MRLEVEKVKNSRVEVEDQVVEVKIYDRNIYDGVLEEIDKYVKPNVYITTPDVDEVYAVRIRSGKLWIYFSLVRKAEEESK